MLCLEINEGAAVSILLNAAYLLYNVSRIRVAKNKWQITQSAKMSPTRIQLKFGTNKALYL